LLNLPLNIEEGRPKDRMDNEEKIAEGIRGSSHFITNNSAFPGSETLPLMVIFEKRDTHDLPEKIA
jgi:hypothetical protein